MERYEPPEDPRNKPTASSAGYGEPAATATTIPGRFPLPQLPSEITLPTLPTVVRSPAR